MIKNRSTENISPPKVIYYTIAFLIVFAVVSISARIWSQHSNELPSGDSAWSISVTHQILAQAKGASLSIPPPWDTVYTRMYAQTLSHTGLRQKRVKRDPDKRDIVLIAPKAGNYKTEAIFNIHVSSLARSEPKKSKLSELNRSKWLSESDGIQINTYATTDIVERLSRTVFSSDVLIEKMFDYVSNNIRIKQHTNNNSETVLSARRATALGSNRALVALLRTAHIPARIVTGVNLQVVAVSQPYYWTEVYDAEKWVPLDPVSGYMKQLPAFYVPLRKGGSEVVETNNANVISTVWKIDTIPTPRTFLNNESINLSDILDLNRLSPASRENLGVLLLLPLGVLATEIMRQLMGIRTYGTFTPTLIALAIIHVDRLTAAIIFLIVTVIGISIRAYMPNLNLQRTPRLAIVFTLVVLSMAIVVSGFMYFDPGMDGAVVLLPVVILTMLVDRIYTIADQRGMRTAMIRLFWTAVAAFVSLFVLSQSDWSPWLVAYPEMHAITLAIIIIIGLYQGPKLSGLSALRWLHEPELRRVRKTEKASQSEQSGDNM